MFRSDETSTAWAAGFLAVVVHAILLGVLLFSFNWKASPTIVSVSEVELWDALPTAKPAPERRIAPPKPKEPKVKPPEPKPEPMPESKPEPVVEDVPEPETPKVDIELENKKKAEAEKKKKAEADEKKKIAARKKKKEAALKALQQQMQDDIDPAKQALKKLQAEIGNENTKPTRAANQGVVNEFVAKIIAKVHGNVNRALCAGGNPVVVFKVSLLPTGEFVNNPALRKSSGNAACDDAVERALIASEPFPLPSDPDTLSEFRNLNLTFKPNE